MSEEREQDLALLETHRRVLQKLREKQARFGASLPTVDALEIEDHLREMSRLERKLGVVLPGSERGPQSVPSAPLEVVHFLPYLANRTAQKDSLRDALRRLNRLAPRPIVCLIHGDENQAQDMFLERLKKYILPELLGVPRELSITEYALSWPDRYNKVQSFPVILPRRIAEAVQLPDDVSLEELNGRLAAQMAPVMFSTFLLTQDWERHGAEGLRSFLRFWQHWPLLSPNQLMAVCLFVTYQVKRESNFVARWRTQRLNAEIAEEIEKLTREQLEGIVCCVPPRLEGIERGEAEHWARSTETRTICPRDEMIHGIRTIYEGWEKKERSIAIPMEELAEELRKLLDKYTGQRREFA